MRFGRWLCLSSGLALLAVTTLTAAQSRRDARLSYERKPGTDACQDEAALRDAVAVRLGYDPFSANKGPLVHVIVRPADKGYRATIELKDERDEVMGTRQVASPNADCVELSSVVALTISMAIDPLAKPGTVAPSTAATSVPVVSPPPASTSPSDSKPAPAKLPEPIPDPPPPSARFGIYTGGALALGGGAPAPAFALLLGGDIRAGMLSLGLEGRVQFASSTAADPAALAPAGTTVSTTLFGAALAGCVHHRGFGACLVPLIGSLRGSATLARAQDQSSLYGALGLRAMYEHELSSIFGAALFAEALGTLTPTTFLFQKGTAWETAPVAATLGVLVKVHFQ